MAEKKKFAFHLSHDIIRVILVVLGSVFSTLVLLFSILTINYIQNNDLDSASKCLLTIFLVFSLSKFVTFLVDRTKVSLIRFITLFVINVILGIIVMFAKNNTYFFALVGGLYCLTIVISRVFKLIQNHSLRSIILNSLIILVAILLSIGLFIPMKENPITNPVMILCILIAVSAFIEVISNATSQMRAKVLFKIIVRTYALEIILGLVTLMVGFSMILTIYEPGIPTFWDGLYHSFATVTTIGFGDFKVETPVGRALTVVMGIYGIIVVAVITSIIVNFYNETAGKKDIEELKDINDEENRKKKKK